MKPEQIIMHVLDSLVRDHEFNGDFGHLTCNELFAFLLSPQGILRTLVQESFRDMSYYDAAYEIAHYEVVLALMEKTK